MSVKETTVDALQFLVKADCTPVFEHRAKIERLFSVSLLLDIPSPMATCHWVGTKGDLRDRLNAKIYILSLVKCKNSICTEERKIYVPPEVSDDVIESVERRTTAAFVPDAREKCIYYVRGSTLSINAAMTAIDEAVGRAFVPRSENCTPKRSNGASRRLSCALQETLTKKNQRGNYVNATDAVKRAIASCLMEDSDDKPVDDDSVILIDGDTDEEMEPIVIEDDDDIDDDVMIVETPSKIKDQTEQRDDFKENEPANNGSVEQLTHAFRNMDTPSKALFKSTGPNNKIKAAVKPLNFDNLSRDESTLGSKDESGSLGESEDVAGKHKKKKKKKKKRTASKIDDDNDEVITINDDIPAFQSKGSSSSTVDRANHSKRQRLKSVIIRPNIADKSNYSDKRKDKNSLKSKELLKDVVNDSSKARIDDDKEKSTYKPKDVTANRNALPSKEQDMVDGRVKDNSHYMDAMPDEYTLPPRNNNSVIPRNRPSGFSDDLRYIVIDGSNVAMSHGQGRTFSCKGIKLCIDYFRNRGHTMITVFLPHWRKCRPRDPSSVTYRYVLDDLEKEGYLVYTPSRRIGSKLVASYDDRYVIELAEREDGIVVSNDQYRDLLHEKHSWRRVIETRLLLYTFVRDHFMPPDDPYGQNGPSLDELLRRPRPKRDYNLEQNMYSTLKCLETSNPRSDMREAERDYHYGYRPVWY